MANVQMLYFVWDSNRRLARSQELVYKRSRTGVNCEVLEDRRKREVASFEQLIQAIGIQTRALKACTYCNGDGSIADHLCMRCVGTGYERQSSTT